MRPCSDPFTQVYLLRPSAPTEYIYVLKVSAAPALRPADPSFLPNTLLTEHALLARLNALPPSTLSIPVPTPIHNSSSPSALLPYAYLLLACPPGTLLSTLSTTGSLTSDQNVHLDAQAGAFLRELHAVDHDWYGRADAPAAARALSWQDAFVLLLEEALEALAPETSLDVERARRLLGRAIGAYLFDDVDVPALVALAGAPASFLVGDGDDASGGPRVVCALATGLARALWGDPLFEQMLARPSEALLRGYLDGRQGLTQFARQRIKMLWYQVYHAVLVLVEAQRAGVGANLVEEVTEARKEVERLLGDIENSTCY
jgi:hypothetical protein